MSTALKTESRQRPGIVPRSESVPHFVGQMTTIGDSHGEKLRGSQKCGGGGGEELWGTVFSGMLCPTGGSFHRV